LQNKFTAFRSTQHAVVQSMPILNHFHTVDALMRMMPEKKHWIMEYANEKT
jgi:hypothetical protein